MGLTPTQTTAIDGFLDKLQATVRGRIIAANMCESVQLGLFASARCRDFLLECVAELATRPSAGALIVVEDVAIGFARKTSYLRECKQPLTTGDRISTTMKTETFADYIVAEAYREAGGLPIALPPIPDDLADYAWRLAEITSDPNWIEPTASLGRPFPIPMNCWITTDMFEEDPRAPPYDDRGTEARDALGLIDNGDGCYLIRISFQASSLASVGAHEVARPTFADQGNSRFRVNQTGPRAAEFAKEGWGATLHLGKFGKPGFTEATGVSERVAKAIPTRALTTVRVEFLGPVAGNRGVNGTDDDNAYVAALESPRTPADIRAALLSLL